VPTGPVRAYYGPGGNNVLTGFVDDAVIDKVAFDEQYNNFMNRGYADDPDKRGKLVGHKEGNSEGIDATIWILTYILDKREKRKRKVVLDPEDINGFTGPWAQFDDELALSNDLRKAADSVVLEQQSEQAEELKKLKVQKEEETPKQEKETIQAKSIYHGTQLRDYQGRSFVDPPSDLKAGDHECFLPKRWIHTWTGHTKGVQAIRFFPKYGHLILSSSFDTKVKVCLQTLIADCSRFGMCIIRCK
jgi:pre-mRNA-processing factor 17